MKLIPRLLFKTAEYVLNGKVFSTKEGAEFLDSREIEKFLSPRNKGILLDGVNKRLSLEESYQNALLSARVGAGKTTRFIIPGILDQARNKVSLVI